MSKRPHATLPVREKLRTGDGGRMGHVERRWVVGRAVAVASLVVVLASCSQGPRPPPPAAFPTAAASAAPTGHRSSCTQVGQTITVAENVYGGEVVSVARLDGGIDVVIVDQVEPCLHVGFNSRWENDGTVLGACPARQQDRVTSKDGSRTYLVRQFKGADKLSHVALGYVRYEWTPPIPGAVREMHATDVWEQLPSSDPQENNGASEPTIATFGDTGFFVAWVEDDTVLGVPLTDGARPSTAPINLAPDEDTDIGPPSVAFSRSGRGLVAFTASTPSGVHAFATPITCAP